MNTNEIAEVLIGELAKMERCAKDIKETIDKAEQIRFPIDTSKLEQTAQFMNDIVTFNDRYVVQIRRNVFMWAFCILMGLIVALSVSSAVFYHRWKDGQKIEAVESAEAP